MQQCSIVSSFKVVGSILSVRTVEKHLYLFDSNYFISKIPLSGSKDGFKTQIVKNTQKALYEYSKAVSFGEGPECIVSLEGSPKASILSLSFGKITKKHTFELFSSPIVFSAFSNDGQFVAIGTEDGELVLLKNDSKSLSLFERFEKTGDFVSSVSFSADDSFLCVSYFNKKSLLYDIRKKELIDAFETEDVVEKALFCQDDIGLICVCRSGRIEIYDMSTRQHLYRHRLNDFWPTDAVRFNENTIIISTREGGLLFFDVDEQSTVASINFQASISKLHIDENIVFVCFCDGRIFGIDTEYKINEFLTFVRINKLEEAALLCKNNIFLFFKPEFKRALHDGWQNSLKEISSLLAKGRCDDAYKAAKPYLILPSISAYYESLLSQTAEMAAFFDEIEAKNYAAAYKIAYANASIQKLPAFEALEQIFGEAMKAAISLLEDGAPDGKQAVMLKLKPFLDVPQKRAIIEDFIKNWSNYNKATIFFKNKQFKEFFEICEKTIFLKECKIYKKALTLGLEIIKKINACEASMDYDNAAKLAKLLCDFLPFKEEGEKRSELIFLQLELINLISEYKFGRCFLNEIFAFVEENRELEGFYVFVEFVKEVKEKIRRLYENSKNRLCKLDEELEEYRRIPYLKTYLDFLEADEKGSLSSSMQKMEPSK